MSKTLTIALTTYNRPNFLYESIKSILNQTFKDFDLVILNNGSTNETSSVIDSFSDSRISCVRNHTNNLEFVNKAFDYTDNDFLMIFHDDDIMEPNMIEEMIKIFKSDEEINTISSSINLINSNSKNLNKVRPRIIKDKVWEKKSFIKQYLFSGDIIPCPSTIFRSSLIKKYGGNAISFNHNKYQIVKAVKKPPQNGIDLGLVGKVDKVMTSNLKKSINNGLVPVVAPIGISKKQEYLNINADEVAGEVAQALGAEKLILLTDVKGIGDSNKKLISKISLSKGQKILKEKFIQGGMTPKLSAALEARGNGVRSCHIIDGRVPHAVLLEVLTEEGVGTMIS